MRREFTVENDYDLLADAATMTTRARRRNVEEVENLKKKQNLIK